MQVASVQAAEVALPPLVAGRIQGVFATHLASGRSTGNLLQSDGEHFSGVLALAPGPNDVELRVESDRGTAARFRFRVYSAGDELARYLGDLRRENQALERRMRGLRPPRVARARERDLELTTEP